MKKIIIIIYNLLCNRIYKLHAFVFWRPIFKLFNLFLLNLWFRWLGIMNYQTDRLSGEKYLISKLLKRKFFWIKNPVFFDIWANVWKYSLVLDSVFPDSSIFSFEPQPNTFKELEKNIVGVDNVSIFNMALWSEVTKLSLYDYEDKISSEHASFSKDVIEKFHEWKVKEYIVNVETIQSFCKKENIDHIDFMKIDTEWYEKNIIEGGLNIIKKIKILQVEFTQLNVYNKVFLKDIYDLLPNFEFYRLLPHGLLSMWKYDPVTWEIFAYQNIVLINKSFV